MNNREKNAGTLAAGVGKAVGVGLVVEYKIEVVARLEVSNNRKD